MINDILDLLEKAIDWLAGWHATRQIKKNNPELYKFLCSDESRDPANYVEVQRPEKRQP